VIWNIKILRLKGSNVSETAQGGYSEMVRTMVRCKALEAGDPEGGRDRAWAADCGRRGRGGREGCCGCEGGWWCG